MSRRACLRARKEAAGQAKQIKMDMRQDVLQQVGSDLSTVQGRWPVRRVGHDRAQRGPVIAGVVSKEPLMPSLPRLRREPCGNQLSSRLSCFGKPPRAIGQQFWQHEA